MKSTYLAGVGLLATGLFAGAVAFVPQTSAISPADIGYEGSGVESILNADGSYNLTLEADAAQDLIISSGQTVTLNLNGNTLTNYSEGWGRTIQIEKGGSLTIKDTSDGKTGTVAHKSGSQYGVITNMGTLIIESGNFETAENFDVVRNEGSATISGGNFRSTGAAELIDNTCNSETCGTLSVTGGTFESAAWNLVSFNEDSEYWTAPENAKAVTTISGGTWTAKDAEKTMIVVDGSEVAVSGGSFNYEPEYIAEGYSAYLVSKNYRVAEAVKIADDTDEMAASLIAKIVAGEDVVGADATTRAKVIAAAIEGKTLTAAPVITTKTADEVSEAEAELLAELDGLTLSDYYDVNYTISGDDEVLGNVTEIEEATELRFAASDELLDVSEGYERVYKVVRIHGDDVDALDAALDGDEIVAESAKFSTYVIAYYDVAIIDETTDDEDAEATSDDTSSASSSSSSSSTTTTNPDTSTGTVLLVALVTIGVVSGFGLARAMRRA